MFQGIVVGMVAVLVALGYAEYVCRKYIQPTLSSIGPLTFAGIYVKKI